MTDLDRTIIFIFLAIIIVGIFLAIRAIADVHGHVARIEGEIEARGLPERVRGSPDILREEIRKYFKK